MGIPSSIAPVLRQLSKEKVKYFLRASAGSVKCIQRALGNDAAIVPSPRAGKGFEMSMFLVIQDYLEKNPCSMLKFD